MCIIVKLKGMPNSEELFLYKKDERFMHGLHASKKDKLFVCFLFLKILTFITELFVVTSNRQYLTQDVVMRLE